MKNNVIATAAVTIYCVLILLCIPLAFILEAIAWVACRVWRGPTVNLRFTYSQPTVNLRFTCGSPTVHLRSTYGSTTGTTARTPPVNYEE